MSKISVKLKETVSALLEKIRKKVIDTFVFRVDCNVPLVRFGNDYGGFSIFNIYNDANENYVIYSFGLGEDLSFSEDVMRNVKNCDIFAFDPTPKSIEYVRNHKLYNHSRFHFYKIGLSGKNKHVVFYLPENDDYVSGSEISHDGLRRAGVEVPMKSLGSITKKLGHNKIDLFKMDIEGSEFEVIEGLRNSNITINQICLETHSRFFRFGMTKLIKMRRSLKKLGFILISVEENDLTFIRSNILNN